jgi:hypothetical protein
MSEATTSSSSKVVLISRSTPGSAGAVPSPEACNSASAAANAAATILSTSCRSGSDGATLANAEVAGSATGWTSVGANTLGFILGVGPQSAK